MNSCLMLAVNLQMPVAMSAIFDSEDAKIVNDHHVTIIYAKDQYIDKDEIKVLTEFNSNIVESLEKEIDPIPVLDLFELESFPSGYIVLKMKSQGEWFDKLVKLNKVLTDHYRIKSDFPEYTPHITLAEVEPESIEKYIGNEQLQWILRDSYLIPEDLVISYGEEGEVDKVYGVTLNNPVERFFRIRDLNEENAPEKD